MALRITGIPSSFSSRPVTGAKSSSSAPAGSAGATYANSSGQLINSAGAVVGGAVTKDGVITYGSGAAIPGSGKFVDNNLTGTATGAIAPITQSTMGSATAVTLPNTPVPNAGDYSGMLANTLTSNGLKLDGSSNTPTTTKDSSDVSTPNLDSLMANELNLRNQNAPVKSETIYNSLPEKAAKEAAAREVNQYQSQLNGIVAQRDAQVLQLREVGSQNGVTEAVYGGQKATIEREAAIRALPVSAQLAAAQGNLELAQDNLNTLFKLRVNDANATFEYKNKIIDSVMKYATASEQRVFEQKKLDASNALDQKKTNLSSMNEWAKIALGQPSVMTQFTSLDPSSSTFQKDLAAVQSQVVDFKGILERQKLQADIDEKNRKTGGQNIDVKKLSPEAQALLKSVTNLRFKSDDESGRIIGNVTKSLIDGDLKGATDELKTFGYQKLSASQQEDYGRFENVISSAEAAFEQMSIQNIKAGPYKNLAENAKPWLNITRDKAYADLNALIEIGQAQLRLGFFGTAVTGTETLNARKFLITNEDDINTIGWKLQNNKTFLTFTNDAAIARAVGLPKPIIEEYLTYRVKDRATGKSGTIPRSEYNATSYEILNK